MLGSCWSRSTNSRWLVLGRRGSGSPVGGKAAAAATQQHRRHCPLQVFFKHAPAAARQASPSPHQQRQRKPCVAAAAAAAAAAAEDTADTASASAAADQQQPPPGWRDELLSGAVGTPAAAEALIKLVLRGRVGDGMPYRQATLRPVALKGKRLLQLSLLDARQDTTKNLSQAEAAEQLRALLQLPWSGASLQTGGEQVSVQITRRGRALVQRSSGGGVPDAEPAATRDTPAKTKAAAAAGGTPFRVPQPPGLMSHDRRKALLIPGDIPDPFLQKIGLQTEDGRIRANMQVCACAL